MYNYLLQGTITIIYFSLKKTSKGLEFIFNFATSNKILT